MNTAIISIDDGLTILINYFTVSRDKQQALVEFLATAVEEVMRHQPGFISATIHTSLDGTRVVNYVQWRRREDFEALLENPAAQQRMNAARSLASNEPILYQAVSMHHPPE